MQVSHVLLVLFAFTITAVHSTKVIYLNRYVNDVELHGKEEVRTTGIIVVPNEKPKCKDLRTADKDGRCRRVVNF